MDFIITERFLDLFPAPTIAVVRGEIESSLADTPERVAALRVKAEEQLKAQGLETSTLSSHPHLAAWREAYQKFGVKAKNHKPTHEALARRLLRDEGWPIINLPVDIYLTNQAAHLLPHGGYDIVALKGDLILDLADASEPFEPLGGGNELTEAGEVVYRNDGRIVTRRWNYRDCEATKITESTKSMMLVIESPSEAISPAVIQAAADDLVTRYQECFQGKFDATILRISRDSRRFPIY
jgi:DNA/RNA-binding domain of Phe-tRNA-synthetase-like protein